MKDKQKIKQILKDISEYDNILNQNEEKDIKHHVYYIKKQLYNELNLKEVKIE